MSIGRDVALDLCRVWVTDRALLQCVFNFTGFAASFRGRATSLAAEHFTVVSDDRATEFVFRFTSGLVFEYSDPRGFADETGVFHRGLFVALPGSGSEPDIVGFLELKEPA